MRIEKILNNTCKRFESERVSINDKIYSQSDFSSGNMIPNSPIARMTKENDEWCLNKQMLSSFEKKKIRKERLNSLRKVEKQFRQEYFKEFEECADSLPGTGRASDKDKMLSKQSYKYFNFEKLSNELKNKDIENESSKHYYVDGLKDKQRLHENNSLNYNKSKVTIGNKYNTSKDLDLYTDNSRTIETKELTKQDSKSKVKPCLVSLPIMPGSKLSMKTKNIGFDINFPNRFLHSQVSPFNIKREIYSKRILASFTNSKCDYNRLGDLLESRPIQCAVEHSIPHESARNLQPVKIEKEVKSSHIVPEIKESHKIIEFPKAILTRDFVTPMRNKK